MDEYELLEELEKLTEINHQLADRIAELERKAKAFEQSCRVATTQIKALQAELETNAEPVAWITPDNLEILKSEYGEEVLVRNQDLYTYEIPLYTTPQTKPLSDEEIINIADKFDWHKDCCFEFARAIEERILGK